MIWMELNEGIRELEHKVHNSRRFLFIKTKFHQFSRETHVDLIVDYEHESWEKY